MATVGKCNTKAPSRLKVIEHAKWKAWSAMPACSKDDAMKMYVDKLTELVPGWKTKAKL
jgi:acyl-CoA-binding protein